MAREHEFALEIEDGRIWRLSVKCPYDLDDRDRPCWPYDEGGQRMEELGDVCTIIDWSEAVSPDEILHGVLTVPVRCEPDWSQGEYLVLNVVGLGGDIPREDAQ